MNDTIGVSNSRAGIIGLGMDKYAPRKAQTMDAGEQAIRAAIPDGLDQDFKVPSFGGDLTGKDNNMQIGSMAVGNPQVMNPEDMGAVGQSPIDQLAVEGMGTYGGSPSAGNGAYSPMNAIAQGGEVPYQVESTRLGARNGDAGSTGVSAALSSGDSILSNQPTQQGQSGIPSGQTPIGAIAQALPQMMGQQTKEGGQTQGQPGVMGFLGSMVPTSSLLGGVFQKDEKNALNQTPQYRLGSSLTHLFNGTLGQHEQSPEKTNTMSGSFTGLPSEGQSYMTPFFSQSSFSPATGSVGETNASDDTSKFLGLSFL